jgi:adenylosuccinate synthase
MINGKFNIVIGAQAGSESKGKLSAFLARKFDVPAICMAASPNAGHTIYIGGIKMVSYHLPISAVVSQSSKILLGPSSVIRVDPFFQEMKTLGIDPKRIFIHPRATVITDGYLRREREAGLLKIGSTNQGVGAARAAKIMREEDVMFVGRVKEFKHLVADTVDIVHQYLYRRKPVLCEMTQGFDLDLEHGIDPHYCTSKMINPAMALAEAGVSPSFLGDVYGVLRPYPIRVNNRDGSSGPYDDAAEITWEEVSKRCGSPAELGEITTTTHLPRRVFEFSLKRAEAFKRTCVPDYLCLQFANYIKWSYYGVVNKYDLSPETTAFCSFLKVVYDAPVAYVGTSPDIESMVDLDIDGGQYEYSEREIDGPVPRKAPKGGGEGTTGIQYT